MARNGEGDSDEVGLGGGMLGLPLVSQRAGDVSRKRAEQLARWAESETAAVRVPPRRRGSGKRKGRVAFPDGCVFLAACASGDEEEVDELIDHGADVNTTNVDGLTALHQAVIDENAEMVGFLLEKGAAVNAQDNEGWTALHAAVSCGFEDIAASLLAHGASLSVPNNDGELPSDLADDSEDSGPIKALLSRHVRRLGIDLDAARDAERRLMLEDAEKWAAAGGVPRQVQLHSRTQASPLHVAASKGYLDILRLLLKAGADTDARDADGWSPLHAALHWGEREAAEALAFAGADWEATSTAGQSPAEVAEEGLEDFVQELRRRTQQLRAAAKKPKLSPSIQAHPSDPKQPELVKAPKAAVTTIPRLSTEDKHHLSKTEEIQEKLFRSASEEESEGTKKLPPPVPSKPTTPTSPTSPTPASVAPTPTSTAASLKVSVSIPAPRSPASTSQTPTTSAAAKASVVSPVIASSSAPSTATASSSSAPKENGTTTPVTVKLRNGGTMTPSAHHPPPPSHPPKPLPPTATPTPTPASDAPQPPSWRLTGKRVESATPTTPATAATPSGYRPASTLASPSTPRAPPQHRHSQLPTTSPLQMQNSPQKPLASFTPPYRAESEAERKAHSRKQRETRRSTQGVTLEQLKSAQDLIPTTTTTTVSSSASLSTSQSSSAQPPKQPPPPQPQASPTTSAATSTTTATTTKASPGPLSPVPKWRSQALESATPVAKPELPRPNLSTAKTNGTGTPAPPSFATSIAGITNRATRGLSTPKPEPQTPATPPPPRSPTSTEALEAPVPPGSTPSVGPSLARRRIRKDRRSTGPVSQADLQGALGDKSAEESSENSPLVLHPPVPSSPRAIPNVPRITSAPASQSIAGYGSSSRLSSSGDTSVSSSASLALASSADSAAQPDYKVLYERERTEREKLDRRVAELEAQMSDLRRSPTESQRELEKLRADNVRLKDENGALIRVISKLSK